MHYIQEGGRFSSAKKKLTRILYFTFSTVTRAVPLKSSFPGVAFPEPGAEPANSGVSSGPVPNVGPGNRWGVQKEGAAMEEKGSQSSG